MFGTDHNVYIMKNALEIDMFKYDESTREKMRKSLGYSRSDIVIGCVARLEKQKNHEFLIEVFRKLNSQNKNYKLMLIGKGSLEEKLYELIEKYSLLPFVKFIGTTNEVNKYYQAMDIFALPSLYEGLGIVYVEAQISGLPCISSTNVPIDAKITNDFLFIDLDYNKWVNSIKKVDISKRKSCEKNAIDFNYDISRESCNLDQYYIKMVKGEKI